MDELKFQATGVLGQGLVSALFLTTRTRTHGEEHYLRFRREGRPVIFVFWHGQLLPLVHVHRDQDIAVLISEHGDGEVLARVVRHLGFHPVRGSSTRGATKALRGIIRAARAGHDLGITPDGPKGPPGVFKPGALAAAQATGYPVIPMAVAASGGWRFRSWDAFLVPRPMARLHVHYGEPRFVPRTLSREGLDALAKEMGDVLNDLTARAEAEAAS